MDTNKTAPRIFYAGIVAMVLFGCSPVALAGSPPDETSVREMLKKNFDGQDLGKYFDNAARRIKSAWSPSGTPSTPAVIGFKILKNGEIQEVNVCQESGSSSFDNSAKQAVESVKQFDHLPPEIPESTKWCPALAVFDSKTKDVDVGQIDIDFGPYMASMQKKIKNGWVPPKGYESKRVIVVFKVDKTGQISNARITSSSDVSAADHAAIEAVRSANPLPPLPKWSPASLDMEFTFDYNVKDKTAEASSTKNEEEDSTDDDDDRSSDRSNTQQKQDRTSGRPTGQPASIAPYRRNILQSIAKRWQPDVHHQNIVVLIKLDKQGQLLDAEILEGSGSKHADEGALEVIRKTIYPPLPDWYVGHQLRFKIDMAKVAAMKQGT